MGTVAKTRHHSLTVITVVLRYVVVVTAIYFNLENI